MRSVRLSVWSLTLLLAPAPALTQDSILKEVSTEQTEAVLKSLKLEFKKTPAKKEGIFYYDFQRGGHGVRLYWYGGKDLMLDAVFPKMTLQEINSWNVRAKFSRACLHKDDKGEFTALESNLDLLGGVSEGALRQFLKVFDDETRAFAKFVGGAVLDDSIFEKVTNDKLEAILKGLKIDFEKKEVKGGAVVYDFESNNHKLRLVNFGGQDLMIDAHFKKIKLEDVNKYNLNRKFIRCVGYNIDGKEYTSLEANLDCVGGVSESVIRHFIREFDEEVRAFTEYLKKK